MQVFTISGKLLFFRLEPLLRSWLGWEPRQEGAPRARHAPYDPLAKRAPLNPSRSTETSTGNKQPVSDPCKCWNGSSSLSPESSQRDMLKALTKVKKVMIWEPLNPEDVQFLTKNHLAAIMRVSNLHSSFQMPAKKTNSCKGHYIPKKQISRNFMK